jgi:hypothetical protein
MLSEYEAYVLTNSRSRPVDCRVGGADPEKLGLGVGVAFIVMALMVAVLGAVGAFHDVSGQFDAVASPRLEMVGVVSDPKAVIVRPVGTTSGTRTDSRTGATVPLFLGYLEFDWDPDTSGGVPGFDFRPPLMSAQVLGAANWRGD